MQLEKKDGLFVQQSELKWNELKSSAALFFLETPQAADCKRR